MSVVHAQRGTNAEVELRVQEIREAIRDLPPASQDEVLTELARAAVEFEHNRRVDPLLHFVDSLLMTARLHRNPRYLKALAAADDEGDRSGESVDIGHWLAERGVTRSNR